MKWLVSILFAALVSMFFAGVNPGLKSLVYAESTPTSAEVEVEDQQDVGVSGSIKACDLFGFVWNCKVKKGKVTGNVETGSCGDWKVTGTYNKKTKAITLTATNQTGGTGCCSSFTYSGTYNNKTKAGSGTWTNACSGSGSWTMQKCS